MSRYTADSAPHAVGGHPVSTAVQLIDYRDLNPAQRAQLSAIQLLPEQLQYAGDVASALYLLLSCNSDQRRAVALLLDDVPRAFLLLQCGAFLPAWAAADAATITALQVDHRFQGRGVGRACLQALPGLVQAMWPDVCRLQLSVDRANHAGLAFYQATGWQDTGEGYRARSGYECCLTLTL
ncbi:GCN5-related N-acetyltransferase [Pseudomonas reidholzensis]|uniref:GCN5-related N-acetyltransferase n=1 Tax=Pseudomonas reidholzensis TaxID=1785162 RepID=A0A383S1S4_9PSED|nr:GCN5-related N-acetyltransferase [Pseudomonas reidholzensis]